MPLQRLLPGSGQMLPPQPGDDHLRFTFKLWGSPSPPDEPLSDIRGFIGTFAGRTFTILDTENDDWMSPPWVHDSDGLPRRSTAPASIDRGRPMPDWFNLGFEIEQLNEPPTVVRIGRFPVVARTYAIAVPESALPPRNSPAVLSIELSDHHPSVNPHLFNLVLVQLAARSRPRSRRWYRGPRNIGTVAQVHLGDRTGPWATWTSPVASLFWTWTRAPVTFSGRIFEPAGDTDRASGLSGAFLVIRDITSQPVRIYDFSRAQWRVAEPPLTPVQPPADPHLELDMTYRSAGLASFETTWAHEANGHYEASLHVVDKAGNENVYAHPFTIDNDDPDIAFVTPARGQPIFGPEAMIEFEMREPWPWRTISVQIQHTEKGRYWDDAAGDWTTRPTSFELPVVVGGVRSRFSYSWTPGLDDAVFQITVVAADQTGNQRVLTRSVQYSKRDTFPPEIRIVQPPNQSAHPSGSVQVSGLVRDNHQLAADNVFLDVSFLDADGNQQPVGIYLLELAPGPSGWQSWALPLDYGNQSGTYILTAVAFDTSDNQGQDEIMIQLG